MLKNKVSIERQINERHYQFLVPTEASLVECISIVDDIRSYLVARLKEVEESQKKEQKLESNS